MFDVVILTESRYINPVKKDWYIDQVLLEDKILKQALEKKGLKVCKKDWADQKFDWSSCKSAIFRTTWNYFEKFNDFFKWIQETKDKTTFINSIDAIKWNINKNYLQDLAENGINITPTIFLEKKEEITLKKLFKKTNWKEIVIKPAISGAARNTYRINYNNYWKYEKIFQELVNQECMLFQEFMQNITIQGEISLIMIGGKYTHAVRKIAKKGDFRVQDDHGGKVQKYEATKEEINFAEKCINRCPFTSTYARVDIVYDNKQEPALIELELIEPELWFRNNEDSAMYLSEEILNLLSSK